MQAPDPDPRVAKCFLLLEIEKQSNFKSHTSTSNESNVHEQAPDPDPHAKKLFFSHTLEKTQSNFEALTGTGNVTNVIKNLPLQVSQQACERKPSGAASRPRCESGQTRRAAPETASGPRCQDSSRTVTGRRSRQLSGAQGSPTPQCRRRVRQRRTESRAGRPPHPRTQRTSTTSSSRATWGPGPSWHSTCGM